MTVPPGTPHAWWNAGEDQLHAVVDLTGPAAHRLEAFLTTLFALAQDGKTDKKGVPNLLQSAVILHEYRNVVGAGPPFVRKIVVPPVAWLGRSVGYRRDYPDP